MVTINSQEIENSIKSHWHIISKNLKEIMIR